MTYTPGDGVVAAQIIEDLKIFFNKLGAIPQVPHRILIPHADRAAAIAELRALKAVLREWPDGSITAVFNPGTLAQHKIDFNFVDTISSVICLRDVPLKTTPMGD